MSQRVRPEPVLIGPVGAGKSSVGRALAERLQVPEVALDDVRWPYYEEIGYDRRREADLRRSDGFAAVYRYWKPFEVHALERMLEDHHDCVFHLGAGHSVYEDEAHFRRAQVALSRFRHVILLMPSPDRSESVRVLHERRPGAVQPDGFDFHEHFVTHHSNWDLATAVIYTVDKSEQDTVEEVMAVIATKSNIAVPE